MGSFYIAALGNDGNDGSLAHPWQTIGKVNSVAKSSGDVFWFNGGDTFSDATLTPNVSGTTYTSYGTSRATISRNNADGIAWTNLSGISINNLNVVGSGGTTSVGIHGMYPGNGSNVTVD